MLIGSGVDAGGGSLGRFLGGFLGKLVFAKDLGLFCLVFAMTGVESSPIKGCIQDAQLIQLLDLCLHDFLKNAVIQFPQKRSYVQ